MRRSQLENDNTKGDGSENDTTSYLEGTGEIRESVIGYSNMARTSHCTSHYNRDVNRHHATSLGQPPGTETGTPTASGLKRQDTGGTWYVASLKYT
jgi:hypothetical protein